AYACPCADHRHRSCTCNTTGTNRFVTIQVVEGIQAFPANRSVSLSSTVSPCFLSVETNERIRQKRLAPARVRHPPETLTCSLTMRRSRSAALEVKGTPKSAAKRR